MPVFDIKEGGVVLLVVLLIQRGHFHSLGRGRDDVVLPCFPDPSPRSASSSSRRKAPRTQELDVERPETRTHLGPSCH